MDSSSPFPALALRGLLEAAGVNCSFHRNRMGMGDSNPAAVPHAAEDVQGDDRWMSQVRLAGGPSVLGGCWASAAQATLGTSRSQQPVTPVCPAVMEQRKRGHL